MGSDAQSPFRIRVYSPDVTASNQTNFWHSSRPLHRAPALEPIPQDTLLSPELRAKIWCELRTDFLRYRNIQVWAGSLHILARLPRLCALTLFRHLHLIPRERPTRWTLPTLPTGRDGGTHTPRLKGKVWLVAERTE